MAMIPTSRPPVVPDAMASMNAPPRERMATALPSGGPSWSPSIGRPEPSRRPAGGCPLTRSWTGLVTLNGFFVSSRHPIGPGRPRAGRPPVSVRANRVRDRR